MSSLLKYDNFTGYIVRSLKEANSSKTLMYWWAVDGASGSGSGSVGDADTGVTSAGPSKTLDIASVARITWGRIMPICSLQLLSLLTTGFISGYLLRQAAKSLLSQFAKTAIRFVNYQLGCFFKFHNQFVFLLCFHPESLQSFVIIKYLSGIKA